MRALDDAGAMRKMVELPVLTEVLSLEGHIILRPKAFDSFTAEDFSLRALLVQEYRLSIP